MSKFRRWLIGILVGDSSYIKNCSIEGVLVLRNAHNVSCCGFSKTSIVRIGTVEMSAVKAFNRAKSRHTIK